MAFNESDVLNQSYRTKSIATTMQLVLPLITNSGMRAVKNIKLRAILCLDMCGLYFVSNMAVGVGFSEIGMRVELGVTS